MLSLKPKKKPTILHAILPIDIICNNTDNYTIKNYLKTTAVFQPCNNITVVLILIEVCLQLLKIQIIKLISYC